MNPLRFALGLVAAAASCCGSLQAQDLIGYAKVPFAFQIGKVQMPAGDYGLNYSGQVLLVYQKDHQGAVLFTLPLRTNRNVAQAKSTLEFLRYGDTYVLAQIWRAGSSEGFEFPRKAIRRLSSPTSARAQNVVVIEAN